MTDQRWQFWIDVGGTFTDCLAVDPHGRERFIKVLSSGITKGRAEVVDSGTIRDTALTDSVDGFWNEATLRLIADDGRVGQTAAVKAFDGSTGTVQLDQSLPFEEIASSYELDAELPAPVLGIHKLTGTPVASPLRGCDVFLGTTRGTNALLTRRGARTAFVTTRGFRDLLEIGDQTRPHLFELTIRKPELLYSAAIEIDERIRFDGTIEAEPDPVAVRRQLRGLQGNGIASVAICLLHGYRYPRHEELVGAIADELGFVDVRLSSQVAPLIKMVPRSETTVLDAYLNPVIGRYLDHISDLLGAESRLQLMTSAGSLSSRRQFSGKDSVLSGPAGGVVGSACVARQSGFQKSIGFDMGGTSTDVSSCDGEFELEYESSKAGVQIMTPVMAIETVAAGGGSICRFDGIRLTVGPDSAGAEPGPACYGRGGPLTLTDINVFLGRFDFRFFPFPLHRGAVEERLQEIRGQMVQAGIHRTAGELARGFLKIANHNVAAAIRNVSIAKGNDPRDYLLVSFGGAGGQHCCSVAENLDIGQILVHPRSSILSAVGIRFADQTMSRLLPVGRRLSKPELLKIQAWYLDEADEMAGELVREGCRADTLVADLKLELRYTGTSSTITASAADVAGLRTEFQSKHRKYYGYVQQRELEIVSARATVTSPGRSLLPVPVQPSNRIPATSESRMVYEDQERGHVAYGLIQWQQLQPRDCVNGPVIIGSPSTTVIVDRDWAADVLGDRRLLIRRTGKMAVRAKALAADSSMVDPIELEIFNNSFRSIAEQMGAALRRTSISVNVKERLDFSCAIFSNTGRLIVNAPHIPVHLGAMSETVRATIELNPTINPGDVFVTNDPYAGGSHLPDVTVLTPVFSGPDSTPGMWVASRSHHAEIGGISPGSMPAHATCLEEEGVLIQNFKLVDNHQEHFAELQRMLTESRYPSRNPAENIADIAAQVAANRAGVSTLSDLIGRYGLTRTLAYMDHVCDAADIKTREALAGLPDGCYRFQDAMDDGTTIRVAVTKQGDGLSIDFDGTDPVHPGNLNANPAIVRSAVIYVLRCLIDEDIPLNEGVLGSVTIRLPECFLNPTPGPTPRETPAVVGGNVETSQRIVDVLLGAFGKAAASQGTMNNWLLGDADFGYYETIGGGSGATPDGHGAHAVHCHMSNTRLTDPEVMETRYPVVIRECAIRSDSGGRGRFSGGNGMIREFEFARPLTVSVLSSRRTMVPFGLAGGASGMSGVNWLIRSDGTREQLPGQCERQVKPGDRLRIMTPGGGGFGQSESP